MALISCQECGSEVSQHANRCPKCGFTTGAYAGKSKGLAIVLALFLGGLGIHKFYLGKIGAGFFYLLFCWTFIPAVLGLLDAIVIATKPTQAFTGAVTSAAASGLKLNHEGQSAEFWKQPVFWAVVLGVILLIFGLSQAR